MKEDGREIDSGEGTAAVPQLVNFCALKVCMTLSLWNRRGSSFLYIVSNFALSIIVGFSFFSLFCLRRWLHTPFKAGNLCTVGFYGTISNTSDASPSAILKDETSGSSCHIKRVPRQSNAVLRTVLNEIEGISFIFSRFNCIDWVITALSCWALPTSFEVTTPKATAKRLCELSLIYVGQNQQVLLILCCCLFWLTFAGFAWAGDEFSSDSFQQEEDGRRKRRLGGW